MFTSIINYLETFLSLEPEKAKYISDTYYKEYGLLVKVLAIYNGINTLQYNGLVDDPLPLQNFLKKDTQLTTLLTKLKNSCKVDKLSLFTNAYKNHALRVVRSLGIVDLFDGITYCDYSKSDAIICKPDLAAFVIAKRKSGLGDYNNAFFVNDSGSNINSGIKLGMNSINFIERDLDTILISTPKGAMVINTLADLSKHIPELF